MNPPPLLIRAAMIVDGQRVEAAPGAILIQGTRILASGSPESIGSSPSGTRTIDLPNAVVMPGLVNVHCHLDLTHIGPIPFTGDFVSWVEVVRTRRCMDPVALADSVRRGVELARAGGTSIIGDIAGVRSLVPMQIMRECGMPGVSYVEVFGLGRRQADTIAFLQSLSQRCTLDERGVRLGVQPHAPYSCGPEVYRAAARLGLPLATHLAETREELTFVHSATGPLEQLLRRLGVWDDSIVGHGRHSVEHVVDLLNGTPIVAAHLNYIEDEHSAVSADSQITVAYCPRASAYFGHPHDGCPPHRYRRMLDAGVRVALGTDSLLCLDTPDRISVLDEMRLLHRRDGVEPRMLLRMATICGAQALGFDPQLVTLSPGATAGIIAVPIDENLAMDPLRQALLNDEPPRWIVGPASEPWS